MFTLTPDATSSITGHIRRARYVSPKTASISVVLSGVGTSNTLNIGDPGLCDAAGKCHVGVAAPPGNDTFIVSAYSALSGQGALLSRATVQATIAPNANTVVAVVLNGVVDSMTLALAAPYPPLHQATTDALTVIAKDAAGATIVGPGGYMNPITLADTDTSGHSSLTKTTLNSPADTTALQYDGGYGAGTITASASGATSPVPLAFFPQITTTETTVPGGRTPHGIIVGPDNALWFVDSPLMLGRITTAGALTEVAPPPTWNPHAVCAGPDGAIWFTAQGTQFAYGAIIRRNADGTFAVNNVGTPFSVGDCAPGADGNVYANFGFDIVQVTPGGTVATLVLKDGQGNKIHAGSPVAGSPDGALWFVDTGYGTIDRYDFTTHTVTIHQISPAGAYQIPGNVVLGPDKRFYFDASFSTSYSVYAQDTAGTVTPVYLQTNGAGGQGMNFAADATLWIATYGLPSTSQTGFQMFVRSAGTSQVPLIGNAAQTGFPVVDRMVSGPDSALWYTRGTAVGRIVP